MESNVLERKNNPSVVEYFNQMHEIINRLSGHGMQCRLWTVALVCSIATMSNVWRNLQDASESTEILLCIIPVFMLYILNAYYHGLEKQMFEWRRQFVSRLENLANDAYVFEIYHDPLDRGMKFSAFMKALISPSVLFFYLFFMAMIMVAVML